MQDKELKIVIKAKDEAEKTLKGVSSNLEGIGKTASKVGKVLATGLAVAGASALAFGVASVKAFSEQQTQMKQVDVVLKNLTKDFGKAKEEVLKVADANRRLGFDGEDTALSITNLLAKTRDMTKANELNVMAMDLARYKNIDLATASKMVGLAYMGNGKVLKEFGIVLDESKQPLDALRDAHKVFAGTAEESSNTIGVSVTRIKNAFVDLQENIGGAINEVLQGGGLGILADAMERISSADFTTMFENAGTQLKGFFNLLEEKTGVFTFFKETWLSLVDLYNIMVKPAFDSLLQTIRDNKVELTMLLGYFIKVLGFFTGTAFLVILGGLALTFKGIEFAIKGVVYVIDELADAFYKITTGIEKAYNALKRFLDLSGGGGGEKKGGGLLSGIFNKIKGKAVGGGVHTGGSYLVGEKGPEMFTPSSNGSITPNYKMAGAGGVNLTINMNGGTYLDDGVAERIGDKIIQQFKRVARF